MPHGELFIDVCQKHSIYLKQVGMEKGFSPDYRKITTSRFFILLKEKLKWCVFVHQDISLHSSRILYSTNPKFYCSLQLQLWFDELHWESSSVITEYTMVRWVICIFLSVVENFWKAHQFRSKAFWVILQGHEQ